MSTVRQTVRLPLWLVDSMEEEAQVRGMTRSQFVTWAIRRELTRTDRPGGEARRRVDVTLPSDLVEEMKASTVPGESLNRLIEEATRTSIGNG